MLHIKLDMRDFVYAVYDETLLSDREKIALNWIKINVNGIEHGNDSLYNHLYGTFSVLKHLKCSEDVCIAGLFHSVYGTEYFNPNIDIDRKSIKKLIGEYSEYLVYVFCMDSRDNIIMNNVLNHNDRINVDLLYVMYANLIEQAYRYTMPEQGFVNIKNKIEFLEKR